MQRIAGVIKLALEADINLMLWGSHGIGKTSVIYAVGESMGYNVACVILGQGESSDILGVPVKVEKVLPTGEHVWLQVNAMPLWLYDMWEKFGQNGKPWILFLDELNRADSYTISAAHQLVLEKRVGLHKLPPGTKVICACNPETKTESAVTELGDAMMDRFSHVDVYATVSPEFLKYTKEAGWDDLVPEFLEQDKQWLVGRQMDFNEILNRLEPSSRSWDSVQRVLKQLRRDNVKKIEGAAWDLIRGLVGANAATTFVNYANDNFDRVITYQDMVEASPETMKKVQRFVEEGKLSVLDTSLRRAAEYIETQYKEVSNWPLAEARRFIDFTQKMLPDLQIAFWSGSGGSTFWEEVSNDPRIIEIEKILALTGALGLDIEALKQKARAAAAK